MVDSDYDGFLDEITGKNTAKIDSKKDENPLVWDVSDRDLAMFSQLSYADNLYSLFGVDLSELSDAQSSEMDSKLFNNTGSVKELKGWKVTAIYDKDALQGNYDRVTYYTNKSVIETYSFVVPEQLRIVVFQKDKNTVIAYRGSTFTFDDWGNNLTRYGILRNDPGVPAVRDCVVAIFNNISLNQKIYLTGHSRGGMLAQNATAEAVIKGFNNRISGLTYFNGIGAFINVGGKDGESDMVKFGDNYSKNVEPLLAISSKIRRHYVRGDAVDPIGWHAVERTSVIFLTDVARTKLAPIILECHKMVNFVYTYMPERYKRAIGELPK